MLNDLAKSVRREPKENKKSHWYRKRLGMKMKKTDGNPWIAGDAPNGTPDILRQNSWGLRPYS